MIDRMWYILTTVFFNHLYEIPFIIFFSQINLCIFAQSFFFVCAIRWKMNGTSWGNIYLLRLCVSGGAFDFIQNHINSRIVCHIFFFITFLLCTELTWYLLEIYVLIFRDFMAFSILQFYCVPIRKYTQRTRYRF